MLNDLFEKIRRVDEIESKLLSIFEGKSWEYIAKALYTILDDIDTASDMCKEDVNAFRNVVMRLQAKKNQHLYFPDGYSLKRVNEWKEPSQEQLDKISQEMFGKDYDKLPVIMQVTVKDKAITKSKAEVDECVCHIYGLDDDELLEFYRSMGEDWNAFNEPYGSDEAEVKEEIRKRGLEVPVNENLTGHARRELELAGMFDKEVEGSEAAGSWNILCAEAVMELMEVFAEQGHSGFSASMTQDLFSRLSKFEALTELTDNSDEWNDISEMQSGEPGWQSSRNPSCFSEDGGKTYWDINEDYYLREDEEDGMVYSGSLSEEEWKNRPMHQSKHIEKEE